MISRFAPARILVVEDDETIAFGLQTLIEDWGYGVIGVAASGEAALALAADAQPDLILMDVRLQGALDGIETAALLRRDASPRLLFLTAQTDAATTRRLQASAPDGVLHKPVDPAHLRRRLFRLLDGERRAARRIWSGEVPAEAHLAL